MQLLSTLAAVSAIASTAQAAKAYVYNHCSYDIYLWAVDTARNPSSPTIVKAGQVWNEDYYVPPTGGVSVKLSNTASQAKVTQFEYTLNSAAIWYDGSNIDCSGGDCPFANENLMIMSSKTSCPARSCKKGTACTGFYLVWNDDLATLSCDTTADTEFHVCLPDAQMAGGAAVVTAAAAVQAAVATPAAAAAAAPLALKVAVNGQINEAVAPMAARAPSPRAAAAVNPRHLHSHALIHARANKL